MALLHITAIMKGYYDIMQTRIMSTQANLTLLLTLMLLTSAASAAFAIKAAGVPANRQSSLRLYFTSQEAYRYVKQHHNAVLFVDVRDPGEVFTKGMPNVADANIPFRYISFHRWNEKKSTFAMDNNPDFVNAMDKYLAEKNLGKDDPVIIICSSGRRAPKAVNLLASAGYSKVYAVIDGYEAWQKQKLPWSRKLDREKMYVLDAEVK